MSILDIARKLIAECEANDELNESDELRHSTDSLSPGLCSSISSISSPQPMLVPVDPKVLASLEEWNRQARERSKRKEPSSK